MSRMYWHRRSSLRDDIPRIAAASLVVGLCSAGSSLAATIQSNWIDGSSNWNTATNWDPRVVPNNNGGDQFRAVIFTGAGVNVGLDVSVTVNGLVVIGSNDRLTIAPGRSISVVGTTGLDGYFNGGIVGTSGAGTGTLTIGPGVTATNAGFLRANGGATFRINGSIDNFNGNGTILAQNNSVVELNNGTIDTGVLTTQGSGVIRAASGSATNFIGVFVGGPFQLLNGSQVGILSNSTNVGVMGVASASVGNININPGTIFTNTGRLRASGGGNLGINNVIGSHGDIRNAGGVIEALNGSVVNFFEGTNVFEGTLATSGSGVIRAFGDVSRPVRLVSLTNTGTFDVTGSNRLEILGNTANTGVMGVLSAGVGNFNISSGSTLTNTGTLRASGGGNLGINNVFESHGEIRNAGGVIEARNGSVVNLFEGTNIFGGTLATSGSGVIRALGDFSRPVRLVSVTNTGTFDANSGFVNIAGNTANTGVMGVLSAGVGSVDIDSGSTLTNTGRLRASGGGNLNINAVFGSHGNILNAGGVIEARNGSVVNLSERTNVFGGTLATSGSGVVRAFGDFSKPVLLASVTNTGTFDANSGFVSIAGNSANTGVMGVFSAGSGNLDIGSGSTLTNAGTLRASGGGNLNVNPIVGSHGDLFNTGVIEALPGSTFRMLAGALDNTGGTIRVFGSGQVILEGTTNLANFNAGTGTLSGGAYNVGGTLQFNDANVVNNAANVLLVGSGGNIVDQFGQNALRSFTSNSGTFTLNNKSFSTPHAFTNSGTMIIGSNSSFTSAGGYSQMGGITILHGTLAVSNLNISGGLFQGVGSVKGNVTNDVSLSPGASPGHLTVNGDYAQSSSGHLLIELAGFLAGTQYDVLNVKGRASLAGFLDLGLTGGFDPAADGYFDVLFADDLIGTFDTVNLPTSSSGTFSIEYLLNATGLDAVRILFDFDDGKIPGTLPPTRDGLPPPGSIPDPIVLVVPEPKGLALVLLGLVAMALVRTPRPRRQRLERRAPLSSIACHS